MTQFMLVYQILDAIFMVNGKNQGGVCYLDWANLASKVAVREDSSRNRENTSRKFVL